MTKSGQTDHFGGGLTNSLPCCIIYMHKVSKCTQSLRGASAGRSDTLPGRRRLRHQNGELEPCPRRIRRFLEPCLLLLLHDGDSHGYNLLDGLKQFGFDRVPVDPSLIYRTLRRLEAAGLASSHWDTDTSGGPPRRVYSLTEDGHTHLASWVADLRETVEVLERFIAAYSQHMTVEQGEHHLLAQPS